MVTQQDLGGKNMKNRARWCKKHKCHDFHYTVDKVPDDVLWRKLRIIKFSLCDLLTNFFDSSH